MSQSGTQVRCGNCFQITDHILSISTKIIAQLKRWSDMLSVSMRNISQSITISRKRSREKNISNSHDQTDLYFYLVLTMSEFDDSKKAKKPRSLKDKMILYRRERNFPQPEEK